ncbi:MAG: WxcM-like domain-containing protein, partial [Candidatus Omnitrophota bacterium]|nr:WxcM-like domain-containing protein [Candidatus Omnitrophota bacterium]
MIEGVKVKKLKIVPDDRGRLMEILRRDDDFFEKFGQVYMTTVKPGVVKAWHYHRLQRDNFCCVKGRIQIGLYDA